MVSVFGLFRSDTAPSESADATATMTDPPGLRDGDLEAALDTLAAILRSYGRNAFDLEEHPGSWIAGRCERWAQHLLLDYPYPDMPPGANPGRGWAALRHFFLELRKEESKFVQGSMRTMRTVLWSFVDTLRAAFDTDSAADAQVCKHLVELRIAASSGSPEELRATALYVVDVVKESLEERKARHEDAIGSLGERLAEVRGALHEANREASTDALTGLSNRASFDRRLRHSVAIHSYTGQPETLLMLDLDGFKGINDEYGHRGGDAVLAAVGVLIQKLIIRRTDFVARFGGEEFAVILDDTSSSDAIRVADRLLQAVRELRVPFDGRTIELTTSIGVAGLVRGDGESGWLEAADRALYRAKRAGRNRIELRADGTP